jgi:DNA-binding LytR/AlgR family response regulator
MLLGVLLSPIANTMQILVVEDNVIQAELMSVVLTSLSYSDFHLTDNAEEAKRLVQIKKFDLVLLDIDIKGSEDGIQVAEFINKQTNHQLPLIYTTFMIDPVTFQRAKLTQPAAYLSKPFNTGDLQRSIEMALYNHHVQYWDNKLTANGWQHDLLVRDSIFVKIENRLVKIPLAEMVWMEVDDKYTQLHTTNQQMIARISLNDLAHKLPADDFVRISRSEMINAVHIANIDLDTYNILMSNGDTLTIGKNYRTEVLKRLNIVG